MILIGMYDSPFVRRVAIAMRRYGMAYEHRNWSVFRDADRIAGYNPMMRVPTLVLDTGEVLVDSFAVIDALDDIAGRERALIPAGGAERRAAMSICALACGLGDKIVSLIYERRVHGRETPAWLDRCRRQITAGLEALERSRAGCATPWWFGDAPGHADIAVACVARLGEDALGAPAFSLEDYPALADHCARAEDLPDFVETRAAFSAPPPETT